MQTVTCPNGVELTWDDTLTVGELVTTYNSGYHILHRIEFRDEGTPLMYYTCVARADGTLVNGKAELCCDASYVRRMSRVRIEAEWSDALEAAHTKRDNLLQFVPG